MKNVLFLFAAMLIASAIMGCEADPLTDDLVNIENAVNATSPGPGGAPDPNKGPGDDDEEGGSGIQSCMNGATHYYKWEDGALIGYPCPARPPGM